MVEREGGRERKKGREAVSRLFGLAQTVPAAGEQRG